jgi:site-specific DNA recombinase
MRAVAYIRCSTEGQATEGVSLQTQTEAIRRYAQYKSLTIIEEIEDAGISGGLNRGRGGFIKLLDRVQAGDVDVIVLYSLERLSRDMLTLLALERLLHEYDVELHTIEGQLDTATPDGFINFAMKAFIGEMERRQVKYRTRRALQHKKGRGEVVGAIPYGYIRDGDRLVPVANEQAIIQEANRLYGEGQRLVDIVDHLNRNGALTRTGNPWTPMQVKRILSAYEETFKKGTTRIGEAARRFIEAVA